MAEITVYPRQLISLYAEQKYDELSDRFLEVLDFLDKNTYPKLDANLDLFVNTFCEVFLFLFSKEDYVLSARHARRFIHFNPAICNVVAMSVFGNTDPQLEILRRQRDSLAKILTLLSPRNSVRFEVKELFDKNVLLASIWYSKYFESIEGFPTRLLHENITRHQSQVDKRWAIQGTVDGGSTFPYSFSTYVDPTSDRIIKGKINGCIRPMFSSVRVENRPNPRRIAIVTARWARTSAVYRSCARFIEALRPDYDLTLIQLFKPSDDFDKSLFSDIRSIKLVGNNLDLSPVLENDFALAYFPDIGMQDEDRYLSNLRFAPIQVMGYGHPVSTFGGEIDYFLGGQAVERVDLAEYNYSERLVLIPGIGAVPTRPDYRSQGVKKQGDKLIVNCAWYAHKANYAHLQALRRIVDKVGRPIVFRFFAGWCLSRHNSYIPFERDVQSVLGSEHVEIFVEQPYQKYMSIMDAGDIAIDSYPFGGFNTIIDSLWLRKPVVALEGTQFINRASSALLRQVGLEELIARNIDEYVEIVLHLLCDDRYRASLSDRIGRTDLDAMVFDPSYPNWFRKAIDYLIQNDQMLKAEQSKKPIFIN